MPMMNAKGLVKAHGISAKHALYRSTGDWFHILRSFPGALIDENGVLMFASQSEYNDFIADIDGVGVTQTPNSNTLKVKQGISSHPRYVRFTDNFLANGEEGLDEDVIEGGRRTITVNAHERNPSARFRCIKRWGLKCTVCKFSFEDRYGPLGQNYIHVHHLIPISSYPAKHTIDPELDLRPVCANCHAMLHRQEPPMTIEDLRKCLRTTS